jgi:hypothetical protein
VSSGAWLFPATAVVMPLLVSEFRDWSPWLAKRLVIWSARRLGDPLACARYEEEWVANLQLVPGKLSSLIESVGILVRLPKMWWSIRQLPTEPVVETVPYAVRTAPRVSVVMPVLNEARDLAWLLRSMPTSLEVVVVDGGSADGTMDVARRLLPSAQLITMPRCGGKSESQLAGFAACSGDIIVTMDVGPDADAGDIRLLTDALIGGADFVKATRHTSEPFIPLIRFLHWLPAALVNRFFGTRYSDLGYGCHAFWAQHLGALKLDGNRDLDVLMSIRAAKLGMRIEEVVTPFGGLSTMFATLSNRLWPLWQLRTTMRIVRLLLIERLGRGPCGGELPN